uniref:Glutathione synthetase n=1 Tax=Gadus morhua TaxID=8049 RepID=A0A8C5CQN2_GADMO
CLTVWRAILSDTRLLQDLAEVAKDTALLNGVLMRTKEEPNSSELVTYAPFTLFPTAVPRGVFEQALAVQTQYNLLVDKISQDSEFLEEALASTAESDDFTGRLFSIYRQTIKEGRSQSVVLGLNRSDYMLDQQEGLPTALRQIEINTIAASFGGLASHTPDLHRHVLKVAGLSDLSHRILDNNPAAGLARGLAKAWELYGVERYSNGTIIITTRINVFFFPRDIPTIRRKFEDVSLGPDKRLFVDGQEVAVVYFRNGYMPQNYPTEQSWETRLLMERSRAIKCPDIATHLAGTKKVQQVLARPGVLERFFPEQPQVVQQIRATFAGLYTLDQGQEGDKTVAMAMANPEQFVLKPQREGGGNNFYGSEICRVLEEARGSSKRTAYILMDKVRARASVNYLLRRGAPLQPSQCLSELGVFGVYVRQGTDMVMNECVGHLLRTKSSEHADGGVAAGVAVLDNPLLV